MAITVDTDKYRFNHGKAPRGFGLWLFEAEVLRQGDPSGARDLASGRGGREGPFRLLIRGFGGSVGSSNPPALAMSQSGFQSVSDSMVECNRKKPPTVASTAVSIPLTSPSFSTLPAPKPR